METAAVLSPSPIGVVDDSRSSPLFDILISLRQLIVSSWLLFNALARALIAFAKFLFIAIKHSSPYTKPLFEWISTVSVCLWNYINGLSWMGKVFFTSVCAFLLFLVYGYKSGMFRRLGKQGRRLYRHTRKTLHAHWIHIKEFSCYVFHVSTEIITIMLPAVTVVLPLRLYLARHVFRRLFTLSTFMTSLWFSVKSLTEFYRNGPPMEKNPSAESSSQPRVTPVARRRSLLDTFVTQDQPVERPKRKTVGDYGTKKSTGGLFNAAGSLFNRSTIPQHDNDDDDDQDLSNDTTPMLSSGAHRHRYSLDDDSDVLGITVWLDYWVVASVFDLLMTIPIILSHLLFRSTYQTPIRFVMFGHIEESSSTTPSYIPSSLTSFSTSPLFNLNPFSSPIPSSFSWKSFAADTYTNSLSLTYDLTYSILLMFVISHKHRYLILARRTLVGIVDTFIYTLTGLQLIPSVAPSTPGFSPRSTQKGLLPQMWVFIQPFLPPTILFIFDLLAHVPQIFLLMLPSFLLRPAVFIVSLVYPLIGSLRALENSILTKQAYWLTFYTLFSMYETLIMRWLRASPMWSWLPFRTHLELLFITIIQLLCLSPQWFAQIFLQRVFSPLQSSPRTLQQPPPQSRSAPSSSAALRSDSPIIKEEIESDDDDRTPAHRQRSSMMPQPSTTFTSALSDPVVPSHRYRRPISAMDEFVDTSSSNPQSRSSVGLFDSIGRMKSSERKGEADVDAPRSSRGSSRQSNRSSSGNRHPEEPSAGRKSTFMPEAALTQQDSESGLGRSDSGTRRTTRAKPSSTSSRSDGISATRDAVTNGSSRKRSVSRSNRDQSNNGTKRYPSRKTRVKQ